jgi:transcriptional regulator with XRE-family HTH domain
MLTNDFFHKEIGSFLKNKRVQKQLTQGQVAKLMGYSSPQFISNIERGVCSPPLKSLKKIASIYEIPEEELIDFILVKQKVVLQQALAQ